jgi:LPXTG-site transpeptidase (sortase) family protein
VLTVDHERAAATPTRQEIQRARARRGRLAGVAASRWTRWGLPALAVVSAVVAVLALEFPTISNWYASRAQHQLAAQLDDPTIAGQVAHGVVGDGQALGHIRIAAIGVDMVLVQGTDAGALAKGPGHYPGTPMPCTTGDVAVAGHRTTFLHPFYNLNELRAGDVISITTPAASCSYVVSEAPFAVAPTDLAVVANTPGQHVLTLTTCTPRGSAAQRLVVKALMLPESLRPAPPSVVGNAA